MIYYSEYSSFIGKLLLLIKEDKLIGLYIGSEINRIHALEKAYNKGLKPENSLYQEFVDYNRNEKNVKMDIKKDENILFKVEEWLDKYFKGEIVSLSNLDIEIENNTLGTKFEKEVWKCICKIPYGKTTTYKSIANKIKEKMGKEYMSAQAVGRAVGKNPISIIVPCHRVIGSNGTLVGYASGIENKKFLLRLEKIPFKE